MTQRDLNRAVAHATGETISTITQMGFCLADPDVVDFDPEPYHAGLRDIEDMIVDWDRLDADRCAPLVCAPAA